MHLAAGKRALLVQDPNGAVTSLETASEKFGKIYGETGKECGESYFYYGKALLELARIEAGVIDNGLEGGKLFVPRSALYFILLSKYPNLLTTRFLLIFALNLPIKNIVPDTEDEEDNSIIEGPKPTEEEAEKIAEDVDQALEENFKELEKKAVVDKNGVDKNGATDGKDDKMETDENDGAKMSCVAKNGETNGEKNGVEKSKKILLKFPTSDPLNIFILRIF